LDQLHEWLNECLEIIDRCLQQLWHYAASAIMQFMPGKKAWEDDNGTAQEIPMWAAQYCRSIY